MPPGAWNHEREKGTEPGKQILSHVCMENNGLKPQNKVILPGRKYKEKRMELYCELSLPPGTNLPLN